MSNKPAERPSLYVKLPWLLGICAFALYLVTLNQWLAIRSLTVISRLNSWDQSLPFDYPFFHLVTLPFKLLPENWSGTALNIFAALVSSITLGLLARSVMLLPHDRTSEQRIRERSDFSLLSVRTKWLPPVLAVLACGLQLTFWENAVSITMESFDLLLFATLIWMLLEFRVSRNDRWLQMFALGYGLSITNNWALIGFAPLFLVAFAWIAGKSFFTWRFFGRMALLFFAGLTLYFLMPLLWSIHGDTTLRFIDVLRANLSSQKTILFDTPSLRSIIVILSLTSILPVVIMGIRWRSSFGETSEAGAVVTSLMFRVVHILFLGACLVMFLDQKFSPRGLGMGMPLLSFYYLSALSVGYYSGYLLLVATNTNLKNWQRQSGFTGILSAGLAAIPFLALLVPGYLAYLNFSAIRRDGGPLLSTFTKALVAPVETAPSLILSDDPLLLMLVRADEARRGVTKHHVLVNTKNLSSRAYHFQLARQHPQIWPIPESVNSGFLPQEVSALITELASKYPSFYLQPSFGYFFETLRADPVGHISKLHPFGPNDLTQPVATSAEIADTTRFWGQLEPTLSRLASNLKNRTPLEEYTAAYYSRALNTWGLALQRAGRNEPALAAFSKAADLNPENFVASVNLAFAQSLRTGQPITPDAMKNFEEQFNTISTWDAILTRFGGFEEPTYAARQASMLLDQGLTRQAMLLYERVHHYLPGNAGASVSLANAYLFSKQLDKALEIVNQTKALPPGSVNPANMIDLTTIEAGIYFNKGDIAKTEKILLAGTINFPGEHSILESLTEFYRNTKDFKKALDTIDRQIANSPNSVFLLLQKADIAITFQQYATALAELDRLQKIAPNNIQMLAYRAFIGISTKDYKIAESEVQKILAIEADNAQALIYLGIIGMETKKFQVGLDALNRLLAKQPANYVALRNRAIINLRAEKTNDARRDYEKLRGVFPQSHFVYYGLAAVARLEKNVPEEVKNTELYLKYSASDQSPETAQERNEVTQRLTQLKSQAK